MMYNSENRTVRCRYLSRSRLDASGVSHDTGGHRMVAAPYANVVQCPEMHQDMNLREIDMHPTLFTKTWLKRLEHPIATPRDPAQNRLVKTDVPALVTRMRVGRGSRRTGLIH